jgi:hypothetical protein
MSALYYRKHTFLRIHYKKPRFLVFLRRSLFFSQAVFPCGIFGAEYAFDFIFLYVFKVLSMFGLVPLYNIKDF